MAVVEKLTAVLDFDDGNFTVKVRGAAAEMKRFSTSLVSVGKNVDRAARSVNGMTGKLRDWSVIIGQSRNVLNQLYFVFGRMPAAIIKTNAEIERMEFLLKGMSNAADEAAKSLDAKNMVSTLFDMARDAPFSVGAMTDSFVKFRSVGLTPLDGSMQSLMDAVAAFGGTDETLKRASIAIQQMGGKGVISMEELRQQLGEAVPQAITVMAQSMGVSYGKLVEEISKGTVAAKPALDAMFNGFQLAFGGRARQMMDTFNGKVAVMQTNLKELVSTTPGMKEFFESTKDLVGALGDLFGSNAARNFADSVGGVLSDITDYLTGVTEGAGIAMGKMASFFSLVSDKWNEEGTVLWVVRSLLGEIKILSEEAYQTMTKLLFGEDQTDALRRRMMEGRDLAEEEIGHATKILEAENDKLAEAKRKRDRLIASLKGTAKTDYIAEDLRFRSDTQGRVADVSKGRADELREERTRLQQEQMALINDYSINADRERAVLEEQLRQNQAALDEEIRIRNERLENQRRYLAAANTIQQKAAAAQQADVKYDAFGDVIKPEVLASALSEMSPIVQELRKEFAEAVKEVEALEKSVESMSGTMSKELGEKADELVEPYIDSLEDLQASFSSQNADLQAEIQALIEDTSLTQEERATRAGELAGEVAATQIGLITDLGAAATSELEAQGAAGMEAAAVFAQYVLSLISSIQSTSAAVPGFVRKGITTVGKPGGGSKKKGKSDAEKTSEKFKTLADDLARDLEKVTKKLADPFGFEIPNAVEKTTDKLQKMIDKLPAGSAAAARFTAEMEKLVQAARQVAIAESMIELKEDARDAKRGLMSGSARAQLEASDEIKNLNSMKAYYTEFGLWRQEHEITLQDRILTIQETARAATPLGAWANEWRSFGEEISGLMADTFGGISDELATMIVDGEADLASFANSILQTFLKISINSGLSAIFDSFSGGSSGSSGGGFFQSIGKALGIVKHGGGIIGGGGVGRSIDASAFVNAPRFHTGGIVGDEVPAILKKKEGVFTPDQMSALGGLARQAPQIEMNIINNSGTQLNSEQGEMRFDGEKAILDVVLSAANQSGTFRDGLKGALT